MGIEVEFGGGLAFLGDAVLGAGDVAPLSNHKRLLFGCEVRPIEVRDHLEEGGTEFGDGEADVREEDAVDRHRCALVEEEHVTRVGFALEAARGAAGGKDSTVGGTAGLDDVSEAFSERAGEAFAIG